MKRPRSKPNGECSLYQFYPDQKTSDLRRVFEAIMSERIEDIWMWK